ncbi:hypothetical protein GALMADRAFT_271959 [Galerina marginata CBS 339.88]|uniref:Thioesterase domain-containing protein n=1 Tax=Galerina marginata (strain CBS 339.88) TaxID=685588 RepID=A0A067SFA0_GALM3|nr:hypothetical protein GALMADRAFT_271959 [Galerina marginata CBS 339.88]
MRLDKALLTSLRQALCLPSFRFLCQLLLTSLLFFNARSFPLVWHVRILRHLLMRSVRTRLGLTPPPSSVKNNPHTVHNPFEAQSLYKGWAGPDDCDFLFHLSNSSYAKNLDLARAEICSTVMAGIMQEGGWMPLAGAYYLFISELPMFSRYEIRSRLGSWDDKWIYLVSEFVTFPTSSVSGRDTKTTGINPVTKYQRRSVRSDGTVLHCVAISVYCFKIGRITVPPRVALSICGFGINKHDEALISSKRKEGTMRHYLEAGWRNEGGCDLHEFETQRLGSLEWCRKLTEGIREAIDALE